MVKNLIFSNSSKNLENFKLEDIPLFDYLTKLVKTLPVSDYNMNIECFKENTILTDIEPRGFEATKDINEEILKFKRFRSSISDLLRYSENKKKIEPKKLLKETGEKMKQILD